MLGISHENIQVPINYVLVYKQMMKYIHSHVKHGSPLVINLGESLRCIILRILTLFEGYTNLVATYTSVDC